jgi:hypothetical protein
MNLVALISYGAINVAIVAYYLRGKGRFYQFPFWAGVIALGWFFPQAVGGYLNVMVFPENAYMDGMFFATLCTAALWIGYAVASSKKASKPSWLDAPFDIQKLYWAGAVLCVFGFFFQWKLWSLPEEMLTQAIWSGATVKYRFLASVFKIGFLSLWLIYLNQNRIVAPKLLLFIIPALLMLFSAVVLRGRRAEMMNLVAYLFVSLWFTRRMAVPRWIITTGLIGGIVFINGIGTYRAIMMKNKTDSLSERLSLASNADYLSSIKKNMEKSGSEFKNFIYYRQAYVDSGAYDFGCAHWNRFIFNFVPAQIVGRDVKKSLMFKWLENEDPRLFAAERYGHARKTGSTSTGYTDAFGSLAWFGFVKFLLVGAIMGTLYRHAMYGSFLGQLLYVYTLGTAMHAISHGTQRILVSVWVYFFALGFPVLYRAKLKKVEDTIPVPSFPPLPRNQVEQIND